MRAVVAYAKAVLRRVGRCSVSGMYIYYLY